ncbi:MAG TPA: [protein-PII] uridylyltransferase [Jiangellaceae bacterium]
MTVSPAARLLPKGSAGLTTGADHRFLAVRAAVVDDDTLTAAQRRTALTELADAWLAGLFTALPPGSSAGMAVVAVGGYGRREVLPGSDLDVLLLHDDSADVEQVAEGVLYPVWNAGIPLDHAVRTVEDTRAVAATDLPAMLGLVDARHVVGDPEVTATLRSSVLADWRRRAAVRLPDLARMSRDRVSRVGELAHLLEPDLKEAYGGLRETSALRAVAASWIADRPHTAAVAEAHEWLLVVRDALHRTTGRRRDRLVFQDQDAVAAGLGLFDADALMRRVSEAGRTIAYAADVTWRQVDRTLRGRSAHPPRRRGVVRRPLADGVVDHDGEAVLARNVRADVDPVLPLRAAAAAAQAGVALSPAAVELMAAQAPPLPSPWPDAARDALVTLLGSGRCAVPVWDALEASGLVLRWLPEWSAVRFRPQRTPVHRHTVDRHLVETAVVASGLTRTVARPDLLLLAALFHDLGKGSPGDHCVAGESIAVSIAVRMGMTSEDAALLGLLVRHHLLLPEMATRRDLDDPSTVATVVATVGSTDVLDLLAALTEADATAAGALAWSPFRARLVTELVARARAALGGAPSLRPATLEPWQEQLAAANSLAVRIEPRGADGSCRVTVVLPARPDALGVTSGVLALHRLDVRAATMQSNGGSIVQVWRAITGFREPPTEASLGADLARALEGRLDPAGTLARRSPDRSLRVTRRSEPLVRLLPGASSDASVLEVRAHDEPGLLFRVATAVGGCGAVVRSAVVGTLGAEAVDVFYLVDTEGNALTGRAVDDVVRAVAAALS